MDRESKDGGTGTPDTDGLAWELLDSAIDYSCPGFDVRRDDVRLPDGTETDYHYVDEPPAVVVLPFVAGREKEREEGEELVVIEEWRQAVGRVSRGLPAGTTEPDDDDLADAARRELTEETGYEAGTVEPLLSSEPINGVANAVHHYFVARDCTPTGEQELDFNESIRVSTAPYDDLLAQALDGSVRDGRTLLGVFAYELHGRGE
ncbi:NUDIX hydrolase [Salinigranum rubrum]|uniref:NUDIX hydrolase n=1 Tax=Salinigranum rubrum TaxID=755307 RepID=A0A2I8VQF8_9EURY|nr:NUDIX hydrolase [Salinigranum rubrum]AUV83359.1 NUDIX hydrolase [Salinigranum rubrum]